MTYSLTTSYATYPSNGYYEYLRNDTQIIAKYDDDSSKITYESLRKKVLGINIYYEELSYILFEEYEKMLILDLVSNIGNSVFFGELLAHLLFHFLYTLSYD